MGMEMVTQQIAKKLEQVHRDMSANLDRVELLTAALAGLSRPVPEYEPAFHHLNMAALRDHELDPNNGSH